MWWEAALTSLVENDQHTTETKLGASGCSILFFPRRNMLNYAKICSNEPCTQGFGRLDARQVVTLPFFEDLSSLQPSGTSECTLVVATVLC